MLRKLALVCFESVSQRLIISDALFTGLGSYHSRMLAAATSRLDHLTIGLLHGCTVRGHGLRHGSAIGLKERLGALRGHHHAWLLHHTGLLLHHAGLRLHHAGLTLHHAGLHHTWLLLHHTWLGLHHAGVGGLGEWLSGSGRVVGSGHCSVVSGNVVVIDMVALIVLLLATDLGADIDRQTADEEE